MSRRKPQEAAVAESGGRQRLIEAALKLAAKSRSVQTIGVRALGRAAGLNPNTFYRHFSCMDDLALALIETLSHDLRQTLRQMRHSLRQPDAVIQRTVEYVFEFADRNPEAFIVGVRELYGASPAVRAALRQMISGLADDIVDDTRLLETAPDVPEETLREIAEMIVPQIFHNVLDYLERPSRRTLLLHQSVRFVAMLFAGAAALEGKTVARK
ncbi:MAG TPA: TetR family transcriptional regulator [Stenotrophobium sp.]|nr:TetR family transcriptional regulator [Stenotrophobium sp.]